MGYYQGDPGFLSGFGKVLGAVGSFIPGVGGIVSRVGSALAGGARKASTVMAKHPTLSAAGGAALSGGAGAAGEALVHHMGSPRMPGGAPTSMTRMGPSVGIPGVSARGYHMSKPHKGSVPHLVRNRRMRVTNPRALRRAIRRAKGFERLARKVMHFVSPRAHKGRAVFKVRRRSK